MDCRYAHTHVKNHADVLHMVSAGWAKEATELPTGAIVRWSKEGSSVTLVKVPDEANIKFKSVEGQPNTIAESILKLDVVQVGNK